MSGAEVYPVRVDASLDAPLSRWLWLVKWVLVVPHYIVLGFLWVGFVVLSAAAWVAILVNVAATLPALPWIATGLLVGGFACLVSGVLLIAIPLRRMF